MPLRSQKIRLTPNKAQETLFLKHCGYARVAYNAALSDFKAGLDANEWRSLYELKRIFNARKKSVFDWCSELSQYASKNAIHNLYDAVTRWRKKQNRFPKPKNRKSKKSYQADNGVDTVKVKDNFVILPKIGKVRMSEKPRWSGHIRRAVVSQTADMWFLSVLIDVDTPEPPDVSHLSVRGVDVGIEKLATLDDGTVFENPRALATHQRKLRRLNKSLSRKSIGSKNWRKAQRRLSRLHHRIFNVRNDAHHKASRKIVTGCSVIGIESLTVKGLLKNRRLSKALADAALSRLLTYIRYKAEQLGVVIVEADKFFASSKLCSSCGYKNSHLTLSDRHYHCGVCGFQEDRDVNAALNLKQLACSWHESLNACGESVRPSLEGTNRRSRKIETQQILVDFAKLD